MKMSPRALIKLGVMALYLDINKLYRYQLPIT